jgi:DNA end-binding protein Ku
VLYQRGREVLIQPYGQGMLVTELRNHNEVVAAKSVFEDMKLPKPDKDLLEIASMLIEKKPGKFEPDKLEDRYEEALAKAIDAKRKGKKLAPPKKAKPKSNVVDLADVLRRSLEAEGGASEKKRSRA